MLLTGYEQVTKLDSSNMTDQDYKIFNRFLFLSQYHVLQNMFRVFIKGFAAGFEFIG